KRLARARRDCGAAQEQPPLRTAVGDGDGQSERQARSGTAKNSGHACSAATPKGRRKLSTDECSARRKGLVAEALASIRGLRPPAVAAGGPGFCRSEGPGTVTRVRAGRGARGEPR